MSKLANYILPHGKQYERSGNNYIFVKENKAGITCCIRARAHRVPLFSWDKEYIQHDDSRQCLIFGYSSFFFQPSVSSSFALNSTEDIGELSASFRSHICQGKLNGHGGKGER